MPPAPGLHSGRVGCFQNASFSSHVVPESRDVPLRQPERRPRHADRRHGAAIGHHGRGDRHEPVLELTAARGVSLPARLRPHPLQLLGRHDRARGDRVERTREHRLLQRAVTERDQDLAARARMHRAPSADPARHHDHLRRRDLVDVDHVEPVADREVRRLGRHRRQVLELGSRLAHHREPVDRRRGEADHPGADPEALGRGVALDQPAGRDRAQQPRRGRRVHVEAPSDVGDGQTVRALAQQIEHRHDPIGDVGGADLEPPETRRPDIWALLPSGQY